MSSVIPHAWVHRYGVPEGMRLLRLPTPRWARHVGLVLAGSGPVPLLAQTLVEIAHEVRIADELDAAVEAL